MVMVMAVKHGDDYELVVVVYGREDFFYDVYMSLTLLLWFCGRVF